MATTPPPAAAAALPAEVAKPKRWWLPAAAAAAEEATVALALAASAPANSPTPAAAEMLPRMEGTRVSRTLQVDSVMSSPVRASTSSNTRDVSITSTMFFSVSSTASQKVCDGPAAAAPARC